MMIRQSILHMYLVLVFLQIPIGGGIIQSPDYTTMIFAIIDLVFFAFAILIFIQGNTKIDSKLKSILISYTIFFAWATLSSTWSDSDRIGYSLALLFRDILRFFTVLLLATSISHSANIATVTKAFLHVSVVYCLVFLATATYSFDFIGSQGRLMYPDFKDANQPARDLGIFMIFVVWAWHQRLISNSTALFSVALIASTFMFSFSKAALGALIMSLLYLFLFRKINLTKKLFGSLFVISLIASFVVYRLDYFYEYLYQVQGGQALSTLSGRTLIWAIFFDHFPEFWAFGAGIDSFLNYSTHLPNNPGTTHNELMNIAFNYGLFGIGLYIAITANLFFLARSTTQSGKQIVYASLIFFLITGITESNLVGSIFSPFLFLLVGIIAINTLGSINSSPHNKVTLRSRA